MDLVTLVTACALRVDPKLMHALVWHQSGGEPWAISLSQEAIPRPYRSLREALSEASSVSVDHGVVRIGLAGIPAGPSQVKAATFLPCQNVQLAARSIASLIVRCKEHAKSTSSPIACAVAAYRGSWSEPDIKFARAVMASVAKGDAPNFDMPKNTKLEFLDIASETSLLQENAASPGFVVALDDRERGWSSALFPVKESQRVESPIDRVRDNSTSAEPQSRRAPNLNSSVVKSAANSLFVPRSSGPRPQ